MLVFLVDIDCRWKTGLFKAVYERISYFSPDLILNISYVDSFFLFILKRIFRRNICRQKEAFKCGGKDIIPVVIKRGVLNCVIRRLPILHGFALMLESKKIKKLIDLSNVEKKPIYLVAHWGETSGCYSYLLRKYVVKYFNFYHGSDVHTYPKYDRNLLKITLQAMREATLNIFVSNALLKEAIALGYEASNHAVSYNGVKTSDFSVRRLKNTRPIIGFVGNLIPVKGADLLPYIFEAIRDRSSDVTFKIAGDGYLRTTLEREFMRRSLDVEFCGKLQPEEMPKFYSCIDILIIPSRNEALSISAIEALAAGCNVIARNVGGLVEVIEEEYLVRNSSAFESELAEKVKQILDLKPKQKLLSCFEHSIALERELHLIYSKIS